MPRKVGRKKWPKGPAQRDTRIRSPKPAVADRDEVRRPVFSRITLKPLLQRPTLFNVIREKSPGCSPPSGAQPALIQLNGDGQDPLFLNRLGLSRLLAQPRVFRYS